MLQIVQDLRFGTWMGHLEIVKEPFTQYLLEYSNGKVLNQFGISMNARYCTQDM